jgi:hypothetical protein
MKRSKIRHMAKNTAEVRTSIIRAIKKIGGPRKVSAAVDISEANLKIWVRTGDLNDAKAINVFRFARAAGESIEAFLVVEDD